MCDCFGPDQEKINEMITITNDFYQPILDKWNNGNVNALSGLNIKQPLHYTVLQL